MDVDRWDLKESGPKDADHTILLLPGGLCTAAFYDDLMAEPRLVEAPIRLWACSIASAASRASVPWFGG
jgi:hypothetical protein